MILMGKKVLKTEKFLRVTKSGKRQCVLSGHQTVKTKHTAYKYITWPPGMDERQEF